MMSKISSHSSGRYAAMFDACRQQARLAYIPFVVLGDPDRDTCLAIIDTLVAGGATGLELGIPFSDPVADGAVIQRANIRSLAAGTTPDSAFEIISEVRRRYPDLPIGLLLYSNLVEFRGVDSFYAKASAAGVDSILLADVPLLEIGRYQASAQAHGIEQVLIVPPNADQEFIKSYAQKCSGYSYLISRKGITGTHSQAPQPDPQIMSWLKHYDAPPVVQGFGISLPEHISAAHQSGVAGVITGSAIVETLQNHLAEPKKMLRLLKAQIEAFASASKSA